MLAGPPGQGTWMLHPVNPTEHAGDLTASPEYIDPASPLAEAMGDQAPTGIYMMNATIGDSINQGSNQGWTPNAQVNHLEQVALEQRAELQAAHTRMKEMAAAWHARGNTVMAEQGQAQAEAGAYVQYVTTEAQTYYHQLQGMQQQFEQQQHQHATTEAQWASRLSEARQEVANAEVVAAQHAVATPPPNIVGTTARTERLEVPQWAVDLDVYREVDPTVRVPQSIFDRVDQPAPDHELERRDLHQQHDTETGLMDWYTYGNPITRPTTVATPVPTTPENDRIVSDFYRTQSGAYDPRSRQWNTIWKI